MRTCVGAHVCICVCVHACARVCTCVCVHLNLCVGGAPNQGGIVIMEGGRAATESL